MVVGQAVVFDLLLVKAVAVAGQLPAAVVGCLALVVAVGWSVAAIVDLLVAVHVGQLTPVLDCQVVPLL